MDGGEFVIMWYSSNIGSIIPRRNISFDAILYTLMMDLYIWATWATSYILVSWQLCSFSSMLKDVYITRDWAHLFLIIPWSDLVFFFPYTDMYRDETKGYTVWLADLSWRHPTWEEHVFWVVQFLVTVSVRPPLLSIVCLVKHAVWSVIKNVLVFLLKSIFA